MKSNEIILRKTFLATAVCMILESLAQSVGEMIDGIVIGRGLGHEAMAAFGISLCLQGLPVVSASASLYSASSFS